MEKSPNKLITKVQHQKQDFHFYQKEKKYQVDNIYATAFDCESNILFRGELKNNKLKSRNAFIFFYDVSTKELKGWFIFLKFFFFFFPIFF